MFLSSALKGMLGSGLPLHKLKFQHPLPSSSVSPLQSSARYGFCTSFHKFPKSDAKALQKPTNQSLHEKVITFSQEDHRRQLTSSFHGSGIHAARAGTDFPLHFMQFGPTSGTAYLKPTYRHPLPSTKKSYMDAVSQGLSKSLSKNFRKLTPFHYVNSRTTRLKCCGFDHILKDCRKLMRLCFNCSRSGHIAIFYGILSSKQSNFSSTFNNFPHQSCTGINHSNKGFLFRSKNDNLVWQSYALIRSLFHRNLHVKLHVSNAPSRQKKSFWRPNGRLLSHSFTLADRFKPTEDVIMDDLMGEAEVHETIVNPQGIHEFITSFHPEEADKEGYILEAKTNSESSMHQGKGERISMQNEVDIVAATVSSTNLHKEQPLSLEQ